MQKYRHLSRNERDEIAALLAQGRSLRQIAFWLGRSPATLSRELRRNAGKQGYGPIDAQLAAHRRRHHDHRPPPKLSDNPRLRERVVRLLKKGWSPELISGRLRRRSNGPQIGHEAIYRWIYSDARDLIPLLVRSHPRRRPRHARPWPSRVFPRETSIHKRPLEVNNRQVPGHWEVDLMVSRGTAAIQVVVERQTRFVRLARLTRPSAQRSFEALCRVFSRLPDGLRSSVTYDNGPENTLYADLNRVFKLTSYFCDPYQAWQKGTVENTNGLIRRFLPRSTDFDTLRPHQIKRIEHWLNNRPRKCLNYKTPAEAIRPLLH